MNLLLFLLIVTLTAYLLHKAPFIRKSGLQSQWVIGFFLIKVAAGIAYGWFHRQLPDHANTADTWKYFYESIGETRQLLTHPVQFFFSLFQTSYDAENGLRFFSTHESFWNDLRHNIMVKTLSILNIFSGSNYFTNVILYNFLTYFGIIAFIRVMADLFKVKTEWIALGTFLIPSFLFWTSGIHKDGLVFSCISLIAYQFHFYLLRKEKILRSVFLILLWLILLLPLRNYVVLTLIPALFAGYWSAQTTRRKWLPFLVVSAAGAILFFNTQYIFPSLNFPATIVIRHKEFLALGGNSLLPQPLLASSFKSFVLQTPYALNHVLFRPYLTECFNFNYLLSALEIWTIWAMVLVWIYKKHRSIRQHPTILFFCLLAGIMLLLTGYIVPQLGAIVRYRSIYLPFFVTPLLGSLLTKHIK
ncbi:MAG: hypothetical protein KGP35_03285 [Bacteroidetes bacterium]|nr:hypothetical protein [Bacteroidota bacterium]